MTTTADLEYADLEYEREVSRRRYAEAQAAEHQLTAAIERTDATLAQLRADLTEKRKKREQHRAKIEDINRRLSAREHST